MLKTTYVNRSKLSRLVGIVAMAAIGLALSAAPARAALTGPGDIAFVAWNSDNLDGLAFVAIVDINGGEVITFTDNEWDGSVFNTGEGELTWTAPGGGVAAGTVIVLTDVGGTPGANIGAVAVVSGQMNIGASNEGVFALLGTAASPTAFLAAWSNDGDAGWTTLANTGLTAGTTAIDFDGVDTDADIGQFNGSRTGQAAFTDYLAIINNPNNWTTQDAAGDQSNDGTAPDLPFDPTAFTIVVPDAGVPDAGIPDADVTPDADLTPDADNRPDANNTPDAAAGGPDADTTPDAAAPTIDASAPDAAAPMIDAAPGTPDATPTPDAAAPGTDAHRNDPDDPDEGCCSTNEGVPYSPLLFAGLVALLLFRPRRGR